MCDDHSIRARLADSRKDLLDLSGRNRLISCPRGAGRSSRLEVIDELSDEVFRRMVVQQKAMGFLPNADDLSEVAPTDGTVVESMGQPTEEDDSTGVAERHVDDRLQTKISAGRLQKAMLKLHYDARTYEEEQGVNILYLALGFLKWFEDDRSTNERFAPLILVPVSLTRQSAGARFKVAWTQDDLVTNLSLQEKLRHEFRVDLPDVPSSDEWTPSTYFDSVRQAITSVPRWEVLPNDMVLWFFSFSKFLMYRDLDPKVWPEERPLGKNPLIDSALGGGFRTEPPICGDGQNIDRAFAPADVVHVVDADSSQAVVIEDVRRGSNLVIQGPPGTGKSQTITNLIAAAVKDGKRVLFVAEKMAALEVVKRRLDNIGLGDMCLELHSHKANKRAVLEELARTKALARRAPKLDGVQQQAKKLEEYRDKLNNHAEVLHAPLQISGVSAYRALGELVRLHAAKTPSPRFQLPNALQWSFDQFERKVELVRDLGHHIVRLGNPTDHPWRGVTAKGVLPSDVTSLLEKIEPIRKSISRLQKSAQSMARELAAPMPDTAVTLMALARLAQCSCSAPPMDRSHLADQVWDQARQQLDELVEQGRIWSETSQKLGGVIAEAAWQTNVAEVRRRLKAYGRSWFRWFNGKYRDAQAELAGLLVGEPPKPLPERIAILDDLMRGQKAKQILEKDAQGTAVGQQAFGNKWQGFDSDWDGLSKICTWELECRNNQQLPVDFRRSVAAVQNPPELAAALSEVKRTLNAALQALVDAMRPFKVDPQTTFGAPKLQNASLVSVASRLEGWSTNSEALSGWIAYFTRVEKLDAEGLIDLGRLLDNGTLSPHEAPEQLTLAYYEALLREAFRQFPDLAAFDGLSHEQILAKFKSLDLERLNLARQEVAYAHFERLPQGASDAGEMGIINREINKKRNHIPIRKLLKNAGHVVQAMKPVFMMSPISVAQYLEPGVLEFDLLLIDEASQVEPVDAFGAMARCNQVAVVGDDRQLPPTQFFSKMVGDDGDSTENAEDTNTADIESILGLCRAKGMRDQMLRWHYRSRHHSLIAVSNHEFYDDKLFVIPSPEHVSERLGLRFHHVRNGVFDRGRSATNRIEAAAVADAVIDHARQCPNKTLGVGAFSVTQRDAILDELELRRRQHPDLESFFVTATAEPFFVKNLENIQGDERDVIFISVGYGKDSSGFMSMGFGPLSNDGGERRLNVLISRAKERCEVFSSILGDEIDLNRALKWGPKALKAFLRYAQLGELDVAARTGQDFDSEFERQVGKALENVGYEVHPQVGLAGFFIDLAVVDPESPARYLLGIECDGASYHSSRSARDRDRLRQQVLEDRGWIIHRIWSTDWFKQPQEQLRQLLAAIEDAKAELTNGNTASDECDQTPDGSSVIDISRHESAITAENAPSPISVPYVEVMFRVTSDREIHELQANELATVVTQIVKLEGPIHQDEIARRVASLWGLKRTGRRIVDAVERALAEATFHGAVDQSGPFFSRGDQISVPVRDRSAVSSANLLKPEYLPPREVRAALSELVRINFGMAPEEAVGEVVRLLGFRRTGNQLRQMVSDEIEMMVAEGILSLRNGKLYSVKSENDEHAESLSFG